MNRPKFCVGEEVSTAFNHTPNVDRAEIISLKYHERELFRALHNGEITMRTGYTYTLPGFEGRVRECFLRKLPDDNNTLEDNLKLILKTPLKECVTV